MINQQLLDYVRDQLASGFAKEGIKRELGIQGWNEQNVNEVFTVLEKSSQAPVSTTIHVTNSVSSIPLGTGKESRMWSKFIPMINRTFMGISLIFMFGINVLFIATDSSIGLGTLLWFYGLMFVPLGIFAYFYQYENKKLSVRFANTQSRTDLWILTHIIIRNIVFILNFIPLIQIIGGIALIFGAIPYIIIYNSLIRARSKEILVAV